MYNGFAILIIRSNALRSNKSRTDRKRAGSACEINSIRVGVKAETVTER